MTFVSRVIAFFGVIFVIFLLTDSGIDKVKGMVLEDVVAFAINRDGNPYIEKKIKRMINELSSSGFKVDSSLEAVLGENPFVRDVSWRVVNVGGREIVVLNFIFSDENINLPMEYAFEVKGKGDFITFFNKLFDSPFQIGSRITSLERVEVKGVEINDSEMKVNALMMLYSEKDSKKFMVAQYR